MLHNNIQDSVIEELREFNEHANNDQHKKLIIESIINLIFTVSKDYRYTFDENTFFYGAEDKILDAMEYDSESTLEQIRHQSVESTNVFTPEAHTFFWNTSPATHNLLGERSTDGKPAYKGFLRLIQ